MVDCHIVMPIGWNLYQAAVHEGLSMTARVAWLLGQLSDIVNGAKFELDHSPALILRDFKVDRRKPPAAWYSPNANDPGFLLYRPEGAHQEKTTGRKPGAERTVTTKGSDIGLKAKFARLEKRTAKSRRPKAKIASRPFSSQKRSFR